MPRKLAARILPQGVGQGPFLLEVDGAWALGPGSNPPVYWPGGSTPPLLPVGNFLSIGTGPELGVELVSVAANPAVDLLRAQVRQSILAELAIYVDDTTGEVLTGELTATAPPVALGSTPDAGSGVTINIFAGGARA